jgi:hypothetical protein
MARPFQDASTASLGHDGDHSGRFVVTLGDDALPATRDELLRLAANEAPSKPIKLSIRTLLQYWNAKRRGYWITEEINRDLTTAGVATVPPFTEGWIDATIALVPLARQCLSRMRLRRPTPRWWRLPLRYPCKSAAWHQRMPALRP